MVFLREGVSWGIVIGTDKLPQHPKEGARHAGVMTLRLNSQVQGEILWFTFAGNSMKTDCLQILQLKYNFVFQLHVTNGSFNTITSETLSLCGWPGRILVLFEIILCLQISMHLNAEQHLSMFWEKFCLESFTSLEKRGETRTLRITLGFSWWNKNSNYSF